MDKLKMHTPSLADGKFAALTVLFPNAVTETVDENGAVSRAIDKDVLMQEINTHVVDGREERYQFTWPDKHKSVLLANAPIAAALRPVRNDEPALVKDEDGKVITEYTRTGSVDFDATENLYIEGDNLDVLKLLRETYLNRIKMIYIDPPYNTGNDFVYEDDFVEDTDNFLNRDGQYDEQGNRLAPNLNSNGRFHTDWLNMIYPRLRIAKDLLADDGVIFISIDDNEVAQLRKICDEVFGVTSFICNFAWQKRYSPPPDTKEVGYVHESIMMYRKSLSFVMGVLPFSDDQLSRYSNPDNDPRGNWKATDYSSRYTRTERPNLYYPIINPNTEEEIYPKETRVWAMSQDVHKSHVLEDRIWWGVKGDNKVPSLKNFVSEIMQGKMPQSLLLHGEVGHTDNATKELRELIPILKFTAKPTKLIKHLCRIANIEDDSIILDFFSGSATTAHAVMQLNAEDGGKRKFIMVQLPEVCDEKSEAAKDGYATITEIGKERIRRAGRKIKDEAGEKAQDLDIGFRVLKLDSSNMKDVYYTPDELAQMQFDFDGFTDNIKDDRTSEDLLFQVMLELGIPLSAKITQEGNLLCVNDNYLIACFDRVDTALITDIAKKKPYYAVFRDSSFTNDSAMVNFEQVFNTYSPNTIRKVL